MRKLLPYLSVFFAFVVGFSMLVAPYAADAKTTRKKLTKRSARYAYDLYNPRRHYGDEKVTITDASSRCNTPSMRATHVKNVDRAKLDGKPFGLTFESVSTTEVLSPVGEAYKKYLTGLDLAWQAMEEPYCGFGAFGTTAAKKSYTKSIDRIRARFLDVAKQAKVATSAKVEAGND